MNCRLLGADSARASCLKVKWNRSEKIKLVKYYLSRFDKNYELNYEKKKPEKTGVPRLLVDNRNKTSRCLLDFFRGCKTLVLWTILYSWRG